MKATTTWLSEPEKSLIADEAIDLLSTTGMRFAGSEVLPLLAARGAQVDEATGIAKLPRELVEWALAQCPRRVIFAGARPEDDVVLDAGEPFHFAPSGCVAKTLDFRTGVRRRQHPAGPARDDRPERRAAAARRHVDAGLRHGRAARAA